MNVQDQLAELGRDVNRIALSTSESLKAIRERIDRIEAEAKAKPVKGPTEGEWTINEDDDAIVGGPIGGVEETVCLAPSNEVDWPINRHLLAASKAYHEAVGGMISSPQLGDANRAFDRLKAIHARVSAAIAKEQEGQS